MVEEALEEAWKMHWRTRTSREASQWKPRRRRAKLVVGVRAGRKRARRIRLDPTSGGPRLRRVRVARRAEELFDELASREGPVELILAGDFFDFLQIGKVPEGEDRASLTISRPEYEGMFAALARFREREEKRVIYLPGNHDARPSGTPGSRRPCGVWGWWTSSPTTISLPWRPVASGV